MISICEFCLGENWDTTDNPGVFNGTLTELSYVTVEGDHHSGLACTRCHNFATYHDDYVIIETNGVA